MVTISGFKTRVNAEGEEFHVLVLEGDIELVRSQTTEQFYATARHCTITSTFNEVMCEKLKGRTLPGTIKRIAVDPYIYEVPETGEVIELDFMYRYHPEEEVQSQGKEKAEEKESGIRELEEQLAQEPLLAEEPVSV